MAKKRRTTTTKATQKNKKTSKQKKEKKDLLWLFLKIFFVVVLISVVLYYMVRPNNTTPQRVVELPQHEQVSKEKTFEFTQEVEKQEKSVSTQQKTSKQPQPKQEEVKQPKQEEYKKEQPKKEKVTYTNLEIPVWKTTTTHQQIKNLGYTSSYNTSYGIPNWVAYELTRSEAASQEAERTNKFKPDPKVKGKSASNADYKGSGYDKGHMAPAADMKWSKTVMEESFYFTNICPQAPGLNRGAWKDLEEEIREWAIRDSALVIICGPLFTKEPIQYIPQTSVAIPDAYFKVVCSPYTKETRGIAFVFPNSKASKHPREYVVTIDSVEKMTGMDFLSQLPDEIENQIEKTSNYTNWE
ncbi:MAG: DNA/RNA non-specific endonuclease [Muribaculaceae bacterium]|nr:DNA/RNA non-specific endonuclease [Muribaculaceae bacterium]